MPGQCSPLAVFLTLFQRCLLTPELGPSPCQVAFSRIPFLLWFGASSCVGCQAASPWAQQCCLWLLCCCTPGAAQQGCQASACSQRHCLTWWHTSAGKYWQIKWFAFWGFNSLGKKPSCKVTHCIYFTQWLQTVQGLFLQEFKVQSGWVTKAQLGLMQLLT